ncbi:MAG: phosphoribosyltransferase [Bacteroidota bacterium]
MPRKKNFSARIVHLDEVYALSYDLAGQIMNAGPTYDLVVAIARGGMLPARLMCDFLNIKSLTSMQIRHYTQGAEQMETAEVIDPIRVDVAGKNVLVVDDVNDSGDTLQAASEHLNNLNPAVCKTVVIHEKEGSSFAADFVGQPVTEWKWLIYQWALTEDVLEFLEKGQMLNHSAAEAQAYLADTYQLEISRELLGNILELRANYVEREPEV